jgi:hypothetical protein
MTARNVEYPERFNFGFDFEKSQNAERSRKPTGKRKVSAR